VDSRVRDGAGSARGEGPAALGMGLEQRLALLEALGVGGASLDLGAGLGGGDGVGAATDGEDAEEQGEEQGGEHREDNDKGLVSEGWDRVGWSSIGVSTSDWVSRTGRGKGEGSKK
jgi:hypothetical protein